ncbi:hypothetical protein [Streptomyces sp. NPDC014793]|uniref:hypothetical protein n=1 Tax=Streptomyces sp. NPDC014793 TaxID=3364914 RepID=UPI0036FD679C
MPDALPPFAVYELDGEGQAHRVQCRQQARDAIGIDEPAEHDGFEWSQLEFRALLLDLELCPARSTDQPAGAEEQPSRTLGTGYPGQGSPNVVAETKLSHGGGIKSRLSMRRQR